MGALRWVQPTTIMCRSDRQLWRRAVQIIERIRVDNGVTRALVSSVMRVQPNFQTRTNKEASSNKLKGLTTVDAAKMPCSSQWKMTSMSTKPQKVLIRKHSKPSWLARRKSSMRWKHSEFLMCAKNCRKMRRSKQRDGENVPKGDKWRCRFAAREFRHGDQEMEGIYTSGSTVATSKLVDLHEFQHGYSILCSMRRAHISMQRKTRKFTVGLQRNGSRGITPEVDTSQSLVEVEEAALREKEGCAEIQ